MWPNNKDDCIFLPRKWKIHTTMILSHFYFFLEGRNIPYKRSREGDCFCYYQVWDYHYKWTWEEVKWLSIFFTKFYFPSVSPPRFNLPTWYICPNPSFIPPRTFLYTITWRVNATKTFSLTVPSLHCLMAHCVLFFICRSVAVLSIGKPPCLGLQGERRLDLCQHNHSLPCGEGKYVSHHSRARGKDCMVFITCLMKVTHFIHFPFIPFSIKKIQ